LPRGSQVLGWCDTAPNRLRRRWQNEGPHGGATVLICRPGTSRRTSPFAVGGPHHHQWVLRAAVAQLTMTCRSCHRRPVSDTPAGPAGQQADAFGPRRGCEPAVSVRVMDAAFAVVGILATGDLARRLPVALSGCQSPKRGGLRYAASGLPASAINRS
jgi:hypothetical protein